jgi:N-acetyl-anhydromuramyl-L-alanine amidase AmpD
LAFAAFHAHDANSRSIGIEHCARTPGELGKTDVGLPPSDGQYRASAKLVAYLLTAAGLQPTREYVMGHHEIDPKTTHTGCPDSCGWDWSYYINLVRLEFEALVPPTAPLVA